MVCSIPEDKRHRNENVLEQLRGGWKGCQLALLIFELTLLAQCLPDQGYFVLDPLWAKRAYIFIPCECSLACQRLEKLRIPCEWFTDLAMK